MTTDTPGLLDLDAARSARAAAREGRGQVLPLVLGGRTVAELGAEFPLEVLQPLAGIDLGLLIRSLLKAAAGENRDEQVAAITLVADILAVNPDLPADILKAIAEMGRRLLGDEGYTALVEWKPTPWDISALVKGLSEWYGVSLGELRPSAPSAPGSGGSPSSPISSGSTISTPAESGAVPDIRDSSAPAVS